MTEAGSGVGWLRRDRTSDVAAAALITLGGLVGGSDGVAGRSVVGVLLAAAGVALALLHRDRWIERTGGDVWLGTAWWWLRPWGTRRIQLHPERVVIEPGGTGWWARRQTILSVANDLEVLTSSGEPRARAVEILERWTEPSSREYAQSVAASLARWLGVSTGGVLAPFDPISPEEALARLRRSLAALADSSRSRPRRARWQATGRTHVIAVPRRWFNILGWAWVVLLGVALTLLRTWNPGDRLASIVFAAALPVGAALVLEGLRRLLPGRVVTRVGPDALNVERAGLSRELRLRVKFSDLDSLSLAKAEGWWRRRTALELGLRDGVVKVNAAELGLASRDLPWFAGICRDAMSAWLDRSPVPVPEATTSAGAAPEQKPPGARETGRADAAGGPSSVLEVLGDMFPRLANLVGALMVVGLQPLERALSRDVLATPATQIIDWFGPLGYRLFDLAILAARLGGALVAATIALAGYKLSTSGKFRGVLALPILTGLVAPVFVFNLAESARVAVPLVEVCGGSSVPARYSIEVSADHRSFRYGDITVYRATGSYNLESIALNQFEVLIRHAGPLVEVRGLFGARHLVVADGFERICGAWKQRIGRTRP